MSNKPHSQQIIETLNNLKLRFDNDVRENWPDFLFHFADVENVASILTSGELLSRHALIENKKGFKDTSSSEIISGTRDRWKKYVRFYFRPKTPTLYHSEGIRPQETLYKGDVHCPVPIYLLFDSRAILTRSDSMFSEGTLASKLTKPFRTAEEFRTLPFDDIYHIGGQPPDRKTRITHCRQAEVIVPNKVNLADLQYIWCRSSAEREILKNLVSAETWATWRDRIRYGTDHDLFHHYWIYIKDVDLQSQQITIYINQPKDAKYKGPFKLMVDIVEAPGNQQYYFAEDNLMVGENLFANGSPLKLRLGSALLNYKVMIYFDSHLAYYGKHDDTGDIPF